MSVAIAPGPTLDVGRPQVLFQTKLNVVTFRFSGRMTSPQTVSVPHDSTKSRSRNGGGHGGAELARVASWLRRTSAVPREARWRICPGRCDAAGGEVLVGVRNIDTRDTGAAPILREGENVCAPPRTTWQTLFSLLR